LGITVSVRSLRTRGIWLRTWRDLLLCYDVSGKSQHLLDTRMPATPGGAYNKREQMHEPSDPLSSRLRIPLMMWSNERQDFRQDKQEKTP